ncbi:Fructose-1,6-bisphosphatase [Nitrospira sp. KM1]|uniref:class 1 fructose-bisphosphatase n=1 Tax=Nitrospira sp. KM1 TaxID=1936990 RepID=UPI0013A7AD85|nr:class 1 fructose-bisphosphatase [Nitrospira sp. KM1]BCA54192.1 Fructose-1,6-bisphosphatase [Nitrospira sp. KM1]
MTLHPQTVEQFLKSCGTVPPGGLGPFTSLLSHIGIIGKSLARDLRVAGLIDVLGTTGQTNVQGETVKKLDEIANEIFVRVLRQSGVVRALVSEEMEKPVVLSAAGEGSPYLVLFDPLDGSSNTDVNMPLGSIFSVVLPGNGEGRVADADLMRRGVDQVAAGYLLFGSSTMLVVAAGNGVHGFTLDPWLGEYLLTHQNIKIPSKGTVYGANEGNYNKWPPGMRKYFDQLKLVDKAKRRPYSGRYSGCLVADVHRILLVGGIYLYPGETEKPEGKLRLLYEANPLALIVEQAGGAASTGTNRILDIEPVALHQRVPLIIGSRGDVQEAEQCLQGKSSA